MKQQRYRQAHQGHDEVLQSDTENQQAWCLQSLSEIRPVQRQAHAQHDDAEKIRNPARLEPQCRFRHPQRQQCTGYDPDRKGIGECDETTFDLVHSGILRPFCDDCRIGFLAIVVSFIADDFKILEDIKQFVGFQ